MLWEKCDVGTISCVGCFPTLWESSQSAGRWAVSISSYDSLRITSLSQSEIIYLAKPPMKGDASLMTSQHWQACGYRCNSDEGVYPGYHHSIRVVLLLVPLSSGVRYVGYADAADGSIDSASHSSRPLVKFKSHLYYEEKDPVGKGGKPLEPFPRSKILLFKNGKCQGVAFDDILGGTYYPAISLYKTATVTVNFGPDFKYPPQDCDAYKPMSEAAEEAIVDHALCDILYHIEHEGELPEF
ncbi:hypothetical protein NP493_1183g00013 [Ridgeia piscesae]|uniref:Set1/Ash2 histone methyltransferase complex subunit ASH2 n=1 Tax=Ridgeia piscesae TaxID=27915 RepID=A0AAD9NIB2_RIDPI|nr:hypothetical protein NP493_1183g00013 [Ridgeia piscesae]